MASDTITIPAEHANTLAAKRHPQLESTLGGALNDYPCGGESTASEWLAQPEVVKALHVKADGGGMTYQKGKSSRRCQRCVSNLTYPSEGRTRSNYVIIHLQSPLTCVIHHL